MIAPSTGGVRPWRRWLNRTLDRSVQNASPFMAAAGWLGLIGHPVFYLIWKFGFPQPYESLTLRLIGSLLCLPFVFRHYWPQRFARYLPLGFHIAIIYNIPFFFTYFLIQNEFSQIWIFSTIGAAFLLTLLVDWRMAVVFFIGGGIYGLVASVSTGEVIVHTECLQYLVIFLFPLVFGSILNYQLQRFRKLQTSFERRLRKITNENARMTQEQNVLLSHFLSNTIVNKLRQLQRKFDLDTAINLITKQEERFCAIMEADIRNFTKMFGHESELVVAQLINQCFTEITAVGQDLAVIKPVGDAIFMYCDDESGRKTAVSNVLSLAIFFVNSVESVNRQLESQGDEPLNFGIAVHAGKAIYGNLASDTLIDPTIIGLNVNKTARLEELTKIDSIREIVGINAIILSEEVVELGSGFLDRDALIPVDLERLDVQVRDFDDVQRVYALPREAANAYAEKTRSLIETQRSLQPNAISSMEANSFEGVPYYYDMQGFGPNTSWTIIIDAAAFPARAINSYAIEMLQDLNYRVNRVDGQWIVINTANHPGDYDEDDVETLIGRIINDLRKRERAARDD
ncbi:MAG: adenylate/guanylate cyclase domain-containing protein [Candidatus Neomarinimicrobiota bacterium]